MKRISFLIIVLAIFAWFTGSGCGGTDAPTNDADISNNEGTVINLKEGGYAGTSEAGFYFPPQSVEGSINVIVTGTGTSEDDPLSVVISSISSDAAAFTAKSGTTSSAGIIFNPVLNLTAAGTSGSYGTYYATIISGDYIYDCSNATSYLGGSTTRYDGAVIGPDGRQYVGCVKIGMTDMFKANFYIASGSVDDTYDDLMSNIRSLGPLCSDRDCGDLAEPIDMIELYTAYMTFYNPTPANDLAAALGAYENFTKVMLVGLERQLAYESMLFEMFTQKYLWEEYQDKLEEIINTDTGLSQAVRDISKDVASTALHYGKDGKDFLYFYPERNTLNTIRTVMGMPKYSSYRRTLDRMDRYMGALSIFVDIGVGIEDGLFELFLYQTLGAAVAEGYIEAFESEIIPHVKDPELVKAFAAVKKDLLGVRSDRSDGLLYNDMKQMARAMETTRDEITVDLAKILAGKAIENYLTTAIGSAAAASKGVKIGASFLAGVAVSALEDSARFALEAPVLIALSTFIYNDRSSFDVSDAVCPANDADEMALYSSQNIFYTAKLFFALLKESYDRWLVSGSAIRGDFLQWLAIQLGLSSGNEIWTTRRSEQVSGNELKYAAKSIKAVEMMYTCGMETPCECTTGDCCDGCFFRPSTHVCSTSTELSCYWGTGCGSDVAQRSRDRYCSGTSASCIGSYGPWSSYTSASDCTTLQSCNSSLTVPMCAMDIACSVCTHACSTGQTKCEGGRVYNCTTNASGCRIWDSGTACTSGLCASDGLRCDTCTHACSTGEIRCTSGRLYNCTTNASGCRVWDAGTACPTGTCSDATHCAGCTPRHHTGCYSDDVYWYDSCGTRESTAASDCGVDSWTGTTRCSGSGSAANVVQDMVDRGCSGGTCFATTSTQVRYDCEGAGCTSGVCCTSHASYQCSSGDVYWYSGCSIKQDKKQECGDSGYTGSNYCYGGDVYRDYVTRGCLGTGCTSATGRRLQASCESRGCTSGVCNSECPLRTWPNNTLTLEDAGYGVRLRWNAPSTGSWVHHYNIARETGTSVPQESDAIATTTATSFVDTTALRGSRYGYVVYAYADCGTGARAGSTLVRIDY